MKKLTAVLSLLLCLALCTGACFAESSPPKYAGMSPEEIVAAFDRISGLPRREES